MAGEEAREKKRKLRKLLLGLGFDGADGHVRVTRGKEFYLTGGSKETHCEMREGVLRVMDELDRRSRSLQEVSRDEFLEIAEKVGLPGRPKQ